MDDKVTYFNGVEYLHSKFNTATKQKDLPENVKKAIQGDKYIEPIPQEEIQADEIV